MRTWIRITVVLALTAFVGFTPASVRLSATVEIEGPSGAALAAIIAQIVNRGGSPVTAPSKEEWYVIEGISISLSAGEHVVAVEASRARGPGCSEKSYQRYRSEVSTAIDQLIRDASKQSGIPMRYTPKKEPNQSPEPTAPSGRGSS